MKPANQKAKATKPETVHMNVSCSRPFRDALHRVAQEEGRDVSVIIRRVLREKYPTLPPEE